MHFLLKVKNTIGRRKKDLTKQAMYWTKEQDLKNLTNRCHGIIIFNIFFVNVYSYPGIRLHWIWCEQAFRLHGQSWKQDKSLGM